MYTQAFKILLQKISSLLNQAEIDWLTDWHSWRKRVIKLDSSYVVLCSSPTKPLILRRNYSGNKNTQSRLTSQTSKLSFSSLLCIHNMCVCVFAWRVKTCRRRQCPSFLPLESSTCDTKSAYFNYLTHKSSHSFPFTLALQALNVRRDLADKVAAVTTPCWLYLEGVKGFHTSITLLYSYSYTASKIFLYPKWWRHFIAML